MKITIIGQSAFGADVYNILKDKHKVVGVFTIPDSNGKEELIAQAANKDGVPVFKVPRWKHLQKDGGGIVKELYEKFTALGSELNVLAFVTQFIPDEFINFPTHGSIVYHPSILPRHRGASAINWTLMCGDEKGGFTIFFADSGLDTGPILLIKEVDVHIDDNVSSLYTRFLYPEGVKAMLEAVDLIHEGKAPKIKQPEEGATYDAMWNKKEKAVINWDQPGKTIHNFIRGCDPTPGAWTTVDGEEVTLLASKWLGSEDVQGEDVKFGTVVAKRVSDGLVFQGNDGQKFRVGRLSIKNKISMAQNYGKAANAEDSEEIQLTEEQSKIVHKAKVIWASILALDINTITNQTNFFDFGAGSLDVTRMLSNLKDLCSVSIEVDDIYIDSSFRGITKLIVKALSGGAEVNIEKADIKVDGKVVARCPYQIFMNGKFVDAADKKTYDTINPTTEEAICKVSFGGMADVNLAVQAAQDAFAPTAKWRTMSARDRGLLMYRLADLMEQHAEELAVIESVDSGAVKTLALKTHVGMSIQTFIYYAGWCDKIQGSTIPINNARPNFNLCITKKEPIGPCGIVIPWNYPLMMLAWKTAACLAAGNTVVIKPAQVTPLTALKWAELSVIAGFPPGVINIIPGSGRIVGEGLSNHPQIRKLGFTGSTEVGKTIMQSCAQSNLKKVSLELGGKSPLIIFDDCDLGKAVKAGMSACFFNKGENCIAAGRLFVHENIHDEFVKRVVEETKKMVIGDPLHPGTDHGPQNHKAHMDKLLDYVNKSVSEGGKLVYGGKRLERKGYFFEPTIITEVADNTFASTEESFGPIMLISKFDGDIPKVIKRANATEFGLASGVFTNNINKALAVSDGLEAGTCFVNTYNKTDVGAPFGGFKQSGFGKDLGQDALNEYLKTKTVTIEYNF